MWLVPRDVHDIVLQIDPIYPSDTFVLTRFVGTYGNQRLLRRLIQDAEARLRFGMSTVWTDLCLE